MSIPNKIKALFWFIKRKKGPQLNELDPTAARNQANATMEKVGRILDYETIQLKKVEGRMIPGCDCKIPVRIYNPRTEIKPPKILYFHSGRFVMCSIVSHDKLCRRISKDKKAIVISVGYRLVPEYKFPIPVHDCYDATVWTSTHATSYGGDASRLIVMGGYA